MNTAPPTPTPTRVWGALGAAALAVESIGAVHARKSGSPGHGPNDYTLSAITRNMLWIRVDDRTKRSIGRAAFLAGWAAVAVHIRKEAERAGVS